MRLAHFSDVHLTSFPLSGAFALKRLAAVASYSLMGRGRHFAGSDLRLAALLEDLEGLKLDHALCTGDLTGVALESEFERAAAVFGPRRLTQPARYSCLPGNHDRYVPGAAGLFEAHFGALCDGARFPFVKDLGAGVTLVGLDVSRPTSLVDSSGLAGDAQRRRLLEVLGDGALQGRFVVVALHYGLMRADGRPDGQSHGLRDAEALTALLDREDVAVDLVLHGHLHRPFVVRTRRRHVVNAGSATDLHVKQCGFHVYDIDPARFEVRLTRREWSQAEGRYVDVPGSPLARVLHTRS
jgi:3',5'-cyclic AMP phosphodiesterase CpdA